MELIPSCMRRLLLQPQEISVTCSEGLLCPLCWVLKNLCCLERMLPLGSQMSLVVLLRSASPPASPAAHNSLLSSQQLTDGAVSPDGYR
jgi:hypothetical protein